MKIFAIGLNKTGTTTLGLALSILGFNHNFWEPSLMRSYRRGRYQKLIEHTKLFDSFSDWPWPLMVDDLLNSYSNDALFILTVRKSRLSWLESLKKQSEITPWDNNPRKFIYGYDYPHENESHHLDFYETHNDFVREKFSDRGKTGQLLELCWEDGDGWPELCSFLNRPMPSSGFPHENSSHSRIENNSTIVENRKRIIRMEGNC